MRRTIAFSTRCLLFLFICLYCSVVLGEQVKERWLVTAYCSCEKCCGKSPSHPAYGIMASGKKVYPGAIACNWLPFGTKVLIEGKVYTVEDRGAKSLFGSKTNHIKHIDIWMKSHKEALQFGKKYLTVEVME